jgi:hypothetical protein
MRRASVVLRNITFLAGVALPLATAGQTPAPPAPVTTGLILGRVVDSASGRPMGGAVVTLENVTMVMRLASAAVKISIADGEKKVQDITLGGG